MSAGREVVLVADDDEDIVRFVEVNLRLEGFEVITAFDGDAALQMAYNSLPDLILLDVMMPRLDGFEVCQRIRDDSRTKHISVIMLTAKSLSADKVVGLTTGADDYIIKPFDPIELVARVKSALRRSREMRAVNPLTQLPGNVQVGEAVSERVGSGEPFALMYVDLDNFKAFNDHYGFLRGDEAIKLLANCSRRALEPHPGDETFLGHIGGDDFVMLVDPEIAESVAKTVCELWDSSAGELYDAGDSERGHIEVADRRNQVNRFPIMTVSVGISTNVLRTIDSQWLAVEIATEMKQFAKQDSGSSFAVDRRRD
ncbi:MAG: GGDEF domain-containing response regulator [Actinomycetota bacterium]